MASVSRHTQTPSTPAVLCPIGIEEIIPGPFVVLQGTIGDGMRNTIDSMPIRSQSARRRNNTNDAANGRSVRQRYNQTSLEDEENRSSTDVSVVSSEDYDSQENSSGRSRSVPVSSSNSTSSNDDGNNSDFHHVTLSTSSDVNQQISSIPTTARQDCNIAEEGSNSSAILSSLASSSSSSDENHPERMTAQSSSPVVPTTVSSIPQEQTSPSADSGDAGEDSFIVVQGEPAPTSVTPTAAATNIVSPNTRRAARNREERRMVSAIKRWNAECREKEQMQMQELEMQYRPQISNRYGSRSSHTRRRNTTVGWWQRNGKLIILSSIPSSSTSVDAATADSLGIVGDLSPGSTVLGTEMSSFDWKEQPAEGEANLFLTNIKYHFLRIESPVYGYILYSIGDYRYLAPGLPASFCQPNEWMWRVTCPDGAFVRGGLELNSRHLTTLPHGALVRVTRKTVNAMGLSRLRIEVENSTIRENSGSSHSSPEDDSTEPIEGWISEMLNPLSGQRGPIVQPLPFPIPALYRVTLPEGAVIRSGMELSSTELRIAPPGSILKVVGRAFSEHPMDRCIERLKLAGGGGWVSLRLNRPPPYDELVVELVGVDGSFDPDNPGRYHLYAQGEVAAANAAAAAVVALSSRFDRNIQCNESPKFERISDAQPKHQDRLLSERLTEERCLICLTEERTATIVHGGTGHIACCLECARVLKARGDRCPVCRLPIDSVIQHFWA